jgi:hypothetical protein
MIIAESVIGPEQREHHVAVDLDLARAVDAGRLAQLLGDPAQAGQVERHGVARHLPHGREDDADERQVEAARLGEGQEGHALPERERPRRAGRRAHP